MVWLFWLIIFSSRKMWHYPFHRPQPPPRPCILWRGMLISCLLCPCCLKCLFTVFLLVLFCYGRLFADSKRGSYTLERKEIHYWIIIVYKKTVMAESCAMCVDNLYPVRHIAHYIKVGPVNTSQQSLLSSCNLCHQGMKKKITEENKYWSKQPE